MKTIEYAFENYKETHTVYDELIGKVFNVVKKSKVKNGYSTGNDTLEFIGDKSYMFYHGQDCCENVEINDICGDLKDLVGSPILQAEEVFHQEEETDWGSKTWTFYKFATAKGFVTVRWVGESNGYYSESVNFKKIAGENE